MKKIAFATLGCRFNQFETAEMTEGFRERAYEIVPFDSPANLYVINSCTVTAKSDLKCRQMIRKAASRGKVVVTGCYSEISRHTLLAMDEVDYVVDNGEKLDLAKFIEEVESGRASSVSEGGQEKLLGRGEKKERFPTRTVKNFEGRTAAYLKVQTGCDETCSFCVVTLARGEGISDSPENIVERARKIVEGGYKEIVLTGINLGCYGYDFDPRLELVDLLEKLLEIKELERIRLSSINPAEVSRRLIDLMSANDRICRHLHIPLQSGDDTILKAMRRNYGSGLYRDLLLELAERIPGIGIGADVLVGFPGEEENHFENSYRLIEEMPLSYLHTFRYSPREGTDAAVYGDQVPKVVKSRRSALVTALGEKKKEAFRRGELGKEAKVLFETKRDKKTGLLRGYSDNYIPVLAEGEENCQNRIMTVMLDELREEGVKGSIKGSDDSSQ